MGRLKAKGLVKTVRGGAALVRGQLNHPAAAFAAFLDRPFEHRSADAALTLARRDAHALDLAAPHTAPRKPGDEAQLQNADHSPVAIGNHEELIGVALDRGESVAVI